MSQYFLQEVCRKLLTPYTGKDLIQHLYEGINIYFNYTGTTKCLNISTGGVWEVVVTLYRKRSYTAPL